MENAYEIVYLPIKDVKPNPANPRLIKDDAYHRLVKSLADCPALFKARPLICSDRTGELIILGGNMRYRAAKELKYKEVPAIIMAGLTEDQEREIAIKDNGDFGQWDFDILANEWADLPLLEWGVDLPDLKEVEFDQKNKTYGNQRIEEAFAVLIECEDENQQADLLQRFSKEGLRCRSLISCRPPRGGVD